MSYTRAEARDAVEPDPWALPEPARLARLAAWSVANMALVFAEHLAELFAPLLLLAGAVWWAIPRGLDALTLDGPAAELLQTVRGRVPHEVYAAGHYYSAGSLIVDGLWLVAVVALCRTLSTVLATLLLDRR